MAYLDGLLLSIVVLLGFALRELRLIRRLIARDQFPIFSEESIQARQSEIDRRFAVAESTKWSDEQWNRSSREEQAELAAKRYLAQVAWQEASNRLAFMLRANDDLRSGRRTRAQIASEQRAYEEISASDAIRISRYQEQLRDAVLKAEPLPDAPQLAWHLDN